jgi:hypothetical protein
VAQVEENLPSHREALSNSRTVKERNKNRVRCWWLTPIILAAQEAEIKKILIQSQPGQIVHETLSQKKPITKEKGRWSDSRCRP